MSISAMLAARKRLLGIDDNTVHNVLLVRRFLEEQLEPIVDQLYRHLMSIPECAKLLPESVIPALKTKQRAHWARLFDCKLDETYGVEAMRIGRVHFERKVPPYIYLAAYNYVQSLIVAAVAGKARGRGELAAIVNSLGRIITLDIDLALAAYTRAFWSDASGAHVDTIFVE
jgi:hypothetical protein